MNQASQLKQRADAAFQQASDGNCAAVDEAISYLRQHNEAITTAVQSCRGVEFTQRSSHDYEGVRAKLNELCQSVRKERARLEEEKRAAQQAARQKEIDRQLVARQREREKSEALEAEHQRRRTAQAAAAKSELDRLAALQAAHQQRRSEQARPPAGPTISCPSGTESKSDITGVGNRSDSTSPSPSVKMNCALPGEKFGERYNHGKTTIVYKRWDGTILDIPPGFGLWLQDGRLERQKIDASHPADKQPQAVGLDGCAPDTVYETNNPVGTGWVSVGCQLGRDHREAERWVRDHEICEAVCSKKGRVIHPNKGATITRAQCRGSVLVTSIAEHTADADVIENSNFLQNTQWCVTRTDGGVTSQKIKSENVPDAVCETNDGKYFTIINSKDARCQEENLMGTSFDGNLSK